MQLWKQYTGKKYGADISSPYLLFSVGCRPVSYDKGETEIFPEAAVTGRVVKDTEWIFNQKAEREGQHRDFWNRDRMRGDTSGYSIGKLSAVRDGKEDCCNRIVRAARTGPYDKKGR